MTGWIRRILGGIFALCLGFVIVQVADRSPVLEDVRGTPSKGAYHPGEQFHGEWEGLALQSCRGEITRWATFQDTSDGKSALILTLPSIPSPIDRLGVTDRPKKVIIPVTPFTIPEHAPHGVFHYYALATFYCRIPGHWLLPITYAYRPIEGFLAPKPD